MVQGDAAGSPVGQGWLHLPPGKPSHVRPWPVHLHHQSLPSRGSIQYPAGAQNEATGLARPLPKLAGWAEGAASEAVFALRIDLAALVRDPEDAALIDRPDRRASSQLR